MKRIATLMISGILLAGPMVGQAKGPAACCAGRSPVAGVPTVELKGKVSRVQITPGAGMPFVEIKTGDQVAKVQLGSMHYLMAQGFNPRVDDEIVAKAYKLDSGFVAITVSLPAQKRTVRLRDENGWPVWRGGRWRR